MGIGVSVFLLAVGAIFSFAVADHISGVDLTMVGYILMAAGALGLVLTMFLISRRPRAARTTAVTEERRYIDEP